MKIPNLNGAMPMANKENAKQRKNILTRRQMKVLELKSEGKTTAEIARETGDRWNSVDYAIKTGSKNLEGCIKIMEWAMKKNLLSHAQMSRLKKILSKD